MPTIRRLQVAVAGLGRMGARHAEHFLNRTPRAELVAAFTPEDRTQEIQWFKEHLEPWGVTLYHDYDEMLKHGGLEAVVVATVTTVHAEQTLKAIAANKHCLSEKPISTNVALCEQVLEAASKKPHLKTMCGFSRRFDPSYLSAQKLIKSGALGGLKVFRSQTCDKLDPSGFFVAYAEFSGGIFVDCNIHDIDLALWYFGTSTTGSDDVEEPKVMSVDASGIVALQPELADHGDVDNGTAIVTFYGGKMAQFSSSRMMAAGQHDMTEIWGTKSQIAINRNAMTDLVEIADEKGLRRDIPQHYYGRFEQAFVNEANTWTACVLDDKPVPVSLKGSVDAVKIGCALQESVRTGKKLWFDKNGNRSTRRKVLESFQNDKKGPQIRAML